MRGVLIVFVAVKAAPVTEPFDPDRAWRLHRQVSLRPEKFGALLYHYGTRRLSFLKNHTMVALVRALADHRDARSACRAVGVGVGQELVYLKALGVLVESNILVAVESKEAS